MTHYEALGVPVDAAADDVRRAYLRLARAHHPDLHPDGRARAEAERRMQRVNEAWSVLSDPQRRAAYDRSVGVPGSWAVGVDGSAPRIVRPSTEFRPFFEHDEDDDDAWRYEPDEYDPRTALGRGLTMAPVVLAAVGLLAMVGAVMVGLRPLVAVGAACFVLSGLLFLGAPVVAMFKSQLHENRRPAPRR